VFLDVASDRGRQHAVQERDQRAVAEALLHRFTDANFGRRGSIVPAMDALVRAFCEVNEAGGSQTDERLSQLRSLLVAAYDRGQAAYPDLQVPPALFARHLARSIGDEPIGTIEQLAIEDLYLACACVERLAGAAERFEKKVGHVVEKAVARVIPNALDRDEAVQRARRALLMGNEGAPPKLEKYAGRGPLENWASVAAIRVAVSLGRAEKSSRRLRDRATEEIARGFDPEAFLMKEEVRREVEAALEQALQRLEDRERLVLRLHLVSRMTMEDIGKTLGVAHQTVSRWLVQVRKTLLADVSRQLSDRLRVPRSDLASIAWLIASRLDLSISRLLGGA
jgi:RNA polymerase sigma-70 factor (ECF subfamily)